MELKIIKTVEVKSVDQWGQVAPPMRADHWKDGRSAKLLAELMTEKIKSSQLMEGLFRSLDYDTTGTVVCEPEKVTSLPGNGEGRNHDLIMVGKDFVAGIEAKVDEPFGKSIASNLAGASQNKVDRINKMLKWLFDFQSMKDGDLCLKYQLLTGIAGTLEEARKNGVKKALFLVVTFPDFISNMSQARQNRKDYETFCERLGLAPSGGSKTISDIDLSIKWVEVTEKLEIKEI